jgi:hypothetical protein
MRRRREGQHGFTLLEMTVLLVATSILAAMMYTYFGRTVTHGYVPLASLQKSLDLSTAVENMTSDYANWAGSDAAPPWKANQRYEPGERVRAPNREFGHLFQCIEENGESGPSQPAWTNVPGAIVLDGTTRWEVLPGELDGFLEKISRLADGGGNGSADGVVRDYEYGRYGIHYLGFIQLSGGEEEPPAPQDPRNSLKVSLVNGDGERITTLFTTSY